MVPLLGTNNIDLGIYDASGNRLCSNGGTLSAGASNYQILNMTNGPNADHSVRITPGQYYWMAVVLNGTTATLYRTALAITFCEVLGVAQAAGAYPLPATITPATVTSAYLPEFGFISEEA